MLSLGGENLEKGGIWVNPHELTRHQVIERCCLGKLTNCEAAELLNLSIRQIQRWKLRVKQAGILGAIHANRGKSPANKVAACVYEQVTALVQGPWAGFNTLHVRDKLKEEHAIVVGRETLRRLYKRLGISLRKHHRKRRFNRRERKPMTGLLLQMDASLHDWFEDGQPCVLIAAIDDATNEVPWAGFFEKETSLGYLSVMKRIVEKKGLFCAVYVDRHSAFKTIRYDWKNRRTFRKEDFDETQVAGALSELGIAMINAKTPQAKGRIERLFQLFQDRLLKEMRLRNIKTMKEANLFLQNEWLAYHNRRFTQKPASSESAYRPVSSSVNLQEVFSVKQPRLVKNDNTFSYRSILYKVRADEHRASYAKAIVEVRNYPDKPLCVFYKNRPLRFEPIQGSKGG